MSLDQLKQYLEQCEPKPEQLPVPQRGLGLRLTLHDSEGNVIWTGPPPPGFRFTASLNGGSRVEIPVVAAIEQHHYAEPHLRVTRELRDDYARMLDEEMLFGKSFNFAKAYGAGRHR